MGYSIEDSMVRVDRFRPSGKWYDTHAVDMTRHYDTPCIHTAVLESYLATGMKLDQGWFLVCLEPYHKHAHPVVVGFDYHKPKGLL